MNQNYPAEPDQESEQQTGLPKDVIFGLLSVGRRRRILTYLADNEGHATVSDLAEKIAAIENGTEISQLSSQQRKRVYVSLYQCHLPKLDDADVIEYDESRGTVKTQPIANLLYSYLAIEPTMKPENESGQSDDNSSLQERLTGFFS